MAAQNPEELGMFHQTVNTIDRLTGGLISKLDEITQQEGGILGALSNSLLGIGEKAVDVTDAARDKMAGVPMIGSLFEKSPTPSIQQAKAVEPSMDMGVSPSVAAPARETEALAMPEQNTFESLTANVDLAHCQGLACAEADVSQLNNLSTAGVAMNKEQTVNRGSSVMV